jgi:hypothetical protein
METTDGPQDEDKAENMILACVSIPKTDSIIDA